MKAEWGGGKIWTMTAMTSLTEIWPQTIGYLQRVGADGAGPESAGSMEALAGGAAWVEAEPVEAGACSVGLQHRKG